MNTNARIAILFAGSLIAVVILLIVIAVGQRPPAEPAPSGPAGELPTTFAPNTHVLSEGSGDLVLVEFLDFECEACGAFYPVVEQLRAEYGDRVTFAFRYFPLPGHGNSVNAALAVEAAARQDALEPMYARMFETQIEWGERGAQSQAHVFRGYADELGLDMARFDADVADPEVAERVASDFEAGIALGVQSTPTFFLNDRRLALTSFEDLREVIESALG